MKYKHLLIIFLFSFIGSLGIALLKKAPILSNDSYFYIHHANDLIDKGWTYYNRAEAPPYYWLYSHIIALLKIISPNYFKILAVIWNALAWSLSMILLYQTMSLFRKNKLSLILVLLVSIFPECIQWNAYILSDPSFAMLYMSLIYQVLRNLEQNEPSLYFSILFSFTLFLLVFSRPVAFIAVLISVSFLLLNSYFVKSNFKQNFAACSLPILFFIFFVYHFKSQPNIGITENYSATSYSTTFLDWFEEGMIIHDRPSYNIEPISKDDIVIVYYLKVFALRFVHFWHPILTEYSILHLLINAITLLPIFLMCWIEIILQLKSLIKNKFKSLLTPHVYLIAILLAYTAFHSLTLIDFDHRYRYPHLFISVIFSCLLINRFLKKTNTT
jgi:hypothetical protein